MSWNQTSSLVSYYDATGDTNKAHNFRGRSAIINCSEVKRWEKEQNHGFQRDPAHNTNSIRRDYLKKNEDMIPTQSLDHACKNGKLILLVLSA